MANRTSAGLTLVKPGRFTADMLLRQVQRSSLAQRTGRQKLTLSQFGEESL